MRIYSTLLAAALVMTATISFAKTSNMSPMIVGGQEASIGEFPFIVSLQSKSGSHFCGGSLIAPNWVLTAGHCVDSAPGRVAIGLHSWRNTTNAEIFNAKRVIRHPQYNTKTADYDFALIELSGSSNYAPININTAEIAVPTDGSQILATVAGWGYLRENSWSLPANLQKVDIPLVSHEECNAAYNGEITDRMMCAGVKAGGKDSCQGDSGGPLVASTDDNQRYLIGVVSWGDGCARPGKPGVYAKVSFAAPWIQGYVQ
jgi:Secreted trypsin-like serine protease